VDVQTVWQCGRLDTRVSTDGGETWQSTDFSAGIHCVISFADADTGWVFGSSGTWSTTDGGQNWNEVTLPEAVDDVTAISLRTLDEGYLLTPNLALYVTHDGGESWSTMALPLDAYEGMTLPPANLATAAVRFFDAENGVVILSLVGGGESKLVALRTANGGQSWEEEIVPVKPGVLYLTRDGRYLTTRSLLGAGEVAVVEYQSQ